MPEVDEVDVQIDPMDLRIDTFCSSGAGGQSVNTTKSAVRITHIPTGVVVSCQDERSQLKNRTKAMRTLRARIVEAERERQDAETAQNRKAQVGTGERSEKIRTYNFPQNRVTDHRVGITLHKLEQVLEGDLDEFVQALEGAAAAGSGSCIRWMQSLLSRSRQVRPRSARRLPNHDVYWVRPAWRARSRRSCGLCSMCSGFPRIMW